MLHFFEFFDVFNITVIMMLSADACHSSEKRYHDIGHIYSHTFPLPNANSIGMDNLIVATNRRWIKCRCVPKGIKISQRESKLLQREDGVIS